MKEESSKAVSCELSASELAASCDPELLHFRTTSQLKPLETIIGQDRAMRAIKLGLGMGSFGYNLFVAGSPGTGKKTLIRSLVERMAKERETPDDIFYVNNFEHPERPRAIHVPPGVANSFREDMASLISTLREEVPKAFKSEDFDERRNHIIKRFHQRRGALMDDVQKTAKEKGLTVKAAGSQIVTVPVVNGQELSVEQFEELPDELKETIQKHQVKLSETIQEAYRQIREVQLDTQARLKDLDRTVALIATGHYLDELRTRYREYGEILKYLDGLQHDIVDNISDFLDDEEDEEKHRPPHPVPELAGEPLRRYMVNVIVDNSHQEGAPVITETHPSYRNLIGYAEREARMGTLYTDFTMIRAGSILAANRGFLILDLADLLTTPLAWDSLKRVLQDGEVNIQDPGEQYGVVGTLGLRPHPVRVDLKVIVLGSSELYNLLFAADEDFGKLFKIKAEFDTVMKMDEGHVEQYARFVKTLCDKENLKHFEREAVAALIEHSSRMVSDRTRLTLRFSDVADLIREANYWAGQNGNGYVAREDVKKAIAEKIYRSNLFEEKVQEMIDEGSVLIQTSGDAVGQLNGLSVFQIGDYSFGKPTRLTAQVSVGEKGIVNIEREARMSGSIHDKGVLILSGYLHGKYGQKEPLGLNASICFEQSYSGVEGDSASSAELYAILSRLADAPIKQSIAVTGSINQYGVIQPIGGVNEKIEGFFQTCKAEGLTGEQGVMIPHQNVQNLMLREEVVDAVSKGRFHIYQIRNVDEGIEILTGVPSGEPDQEGAYPKGTIHYRVQKRLDEMAEVVRSRYQR
jgi:lon-related putative ATP-dependent protease